MVIAVLVAVVFIGGAGSVVLLLYRQVNSRTSALERNLSLLREELKTKEEMFRELIELNLGLVTKEQVSEKQGETLKQQELLKAEQGRLTITQAELDAVETRLRELEEIERELESSNVEALREVEMLQAQDRRIVGDNEAMKERLQATFEQLEIVVGQINSSQEVADSLGEAKKRLEDTLKGIDYYSEDIAKINKKYVELKYAYDALDIEYAQLYEKHNALMGEAPR